MKALPLFLFFVIVSSFVIGFSIFFVGSFSSDVSTYQQKQFLNNLASSRAGHLNLVLDEVEKDIFTISGSGLVSSVFNEESLAGSVFAREEMRNIAEDVSVDIKEYLEDNPELTKEDLKNDKIFRSIVLRKFGNEGYTFLINSKNPGDIFFHTDKELEESYPAFKEKDLLSLLFYVEEKDVSGFYSFADSEGVIREKYLYGTKIDSDLDFAVVSTNFLDDMVESIRLEKYLSEIIQKIKLIKGYDFYFISSSGNVVLDTGLGDINKNINEIENLKFIENNLESLRADNMVYFFLGEDGFFAISPSFFKDSPDAVGFVVAKISNSKLDLLFKKNDEWDFRGIAYLFNQEGNLLCPSNVKAYAKIVTDLVDCDSLIDNSKFSLGCKNIPRLNLFVLTEMDDIKGSLMNFFKFGRLWISFSIVFGVSCVFWIIFDRYFKFKRIKL